MQTVFEMRAYVVSSNNLGKVVLWKKYTQIQNSYIKMHLLPQKWPKMEVLVWNPKNQDNSYFIAEEGRCPDFNRTNLPLSASCTPWMGWVFATHIAW